MRKIIIALALLGLSVCLQNPIFLNETYTTGIVDIGKRSDIYYWHIESRNKPSADPLVIWLSGGPGCSSVLSCFMENGPFKINDDLTLRSHAFSWNNKANLVYVEQPIGTGFSKAGKRNLARNEGDVSKDFFEFLIGFYKQNPKYKGRPLYVTGESYAGHYIPPIAAEIIRRAHKSINFIGVAIGNGWVNPMVQQPAYGIFAYENNLITPLFYYAVVKPAFLACQALMAINPSSSIADTVCNFGRDQIIGDGPLPKFNLYDIRKPCITEMCYNTTNIATFLNKQDVKDALNVSDRHYDECSKEVYDAFNEDENIDYSSDVTFILENNVKVLIYSGDQDFECSYVGGIEWTNSLKWSSQKQFQIARFNYYKVNGEKAGLIKQVGNLQFLKIFQAGHMVPMDQPEVAINMLNELIGQS